MDRIAVCEVFYLLEADYNRGGILRERPSNARRNMSTGAQLYRMGFRPSDNLAWDTLDEDQRSLYAALVDAWNLETQETDTVNRAGQYIITLFPNRLPNGRPYWVAAVPSCEGLTAQGSTPMRALAKLARVWDLYEIGCNIFGEPMPPELYMLVDKDE